jgi:hypothetical protein
VILASETIRLNKNSSGDSHNIQLSTENGGTSGRRTICLSFEHLAEPVVLSAYSGVGSATMAFERLHSCGITHLSVDVPVRQHLVTRMTFLSQKLRIPEQARLQSIEPRPLIDR